MKQEAFNKMLELLTVECYSNQHGFINTRRVQRIEEQLIGSHYHMILRGKLFDLYAKKDWETLMMERKDLIIVSTHIDCVRTISKFWSRYNQVADCYQGTYDNAITNAAILALMLEDRLPENVLVAFTGEEETSLLGAGELARVFKEALGVGGLSVMTLDVTYEGYEKSCAFTIENAFDRFDEHFYRRVFKLAEGTHKDYIIVPAYTKEQTEAYQEIEQMDDILAEMQLNHRLADHAADGDESIEYHLEGMEVFSFCLPCEGEMHEDEGVTVLRKTMEDYIESLYYFLSRWKVTD